MKQDDPRITAYALGELHGQEKIDFEKELQENPQVQAELDDILLFTEQLSTELNVEECPALDVEQRQDVVAAGTNQKKKKSIIPFVVGLGSLAASIAIALNVSKDKMPQREQVAKDQPVSNSAYQKQPKSKSKMDAIESEVVAAGEEKDRESLKHRNPFMPYVNTPLGEDRADIASLEDVNEEAPTTGDNVTLKFASSKLKAVKGRTSKFESKKALHFRTFQGGHVDVGGGYNSHGNQNPVVNEGSREKYASYAENNFSNSSTNPLSTFSIDIDTASYANIRRQLTQGYLPKGDSVRIEEMLNYFSYEYQEPGKDRPFSVGMEVTDCPWTKGNKLVRIGLKAKDIAVENRPNSNLVFLLDVSGSMNSHDKLPLLKQGLQRMVDRLNEKDRVGIVVYAGSAGMVLEPTLCNEAGKDKIIAALARLGAGGSTNGAGGINQAYDLLKKNFIQGGTNRIILATDGDFNVGVSNNSGLLDLVKRKSQDRMFMTVLGFGQGNLNDSMMEEISNKGNGNYFYIDSVKESRKVLCEKISGTLVTVAKDVKIQTEFNPALVHSYRLIGYDNRRLKKEDFNNDKKDAGEIGAGHRVTALYEIVPVGSENAKGSVDGLKYQPKVEKPVKKAVVNDFGNELLTVKLRYKSPQGGPSTLMKFPLKNSSTPFEKASKDMIFASSVASFGMLLKDSKYKGDATYTKVLKWLKDNHALNTNVDREEFYKLVERARKLKEGK